MASAALQYSGVQESIGKLEQEKETCYNKAERWAPVYPLVLPVFYYYHWKEKKIQKKINELKELEDSIEKSYILGSDSH